MTPLTCRATRRRLHAYHDGELPVSDQISVAAHLDWCDRCAALLADFRIVGDALRVGAAEHGHLSFDNAASFHAAVVSRANAEREASFVARVRDMFDDMHLVYAGLGATVAAAVCVVVMLGMMRFATRERPDSLAAIVNLLASPGSNENPFTIDDRVLMPRSLDDAFSTAAASAEEDAVFTLAAVVTREGRIENLELLHAHGDDAQLVEGLLDAVARARFEPALFDGSPVAVNMVWLVAHTTVRATSTKGQNVDLPVAPARKRAASLAVARDSIATA
ncbi:MAG: zf-HC2 domain-containing protein [Betaproteobacteria bacterium]